MKILLSTDAHVDGREAMHERLEAVVTEVLGPFGNRIICVEARLTDANGTRHDSPPLIHCTLQAHLVAREHAIARHSAGTANQAIHGALRKLAYSVADRFAKPDRGCASFSFVDTSLIEAQESAAVPF